MIGISTLKFPLETPILKPCQAPPRSHRRPKPLPEAGVGGGSDLLRRQKPSTSSLIRIFWLNFPKYHIKPTSIYVLGTTPSPRLRLSSPFAQAGQAGDRPDRKPRRGIAHACHRQPPKHTPPPPRPPSGLCFSHP